MIRVERLKKLLQRLVDIYSPSGKEEEILAYLKGYLKRHQLQVVAQPVDESRFNLVAAPINTDIQLAFIGHLDTASAFDLENYGYIEEGDTIRGLGTADMKGGCAAMIEAFLALNELGRHQTPVALCLVVGEEESGDGAEKLMRNYHFPWAIIGEPTDLVPCLQSFGYLEIQIITRGKRRHASLANAGKNAIETMLNKMLRVSRYIGQTHPEIVYNIRDLFSSPAGFAVPEQCEAWMDIHLPPTAPIGEIVTELEEVVTEKPSKDAAAEVLFRSVTIDAGYDLPEKGPTVEAIKAVYAALDRPWQTQAFRSHSDANQIWAAGTKPILLGPGRLEKAHTSDETVSFQQVSLAAEIYLNLMLQGFPEKN
jgi:acetylornithine deacetylase